MSKITNSCRDNRAIGKRRDREILEAVESRRALETEQVRAIIFPGMSSGLRKAQEKLLKLAKKGRLQRERVDDGVFAYFRDVRPGALRHTLGVNWLRIWLEKQMKSWEAFHSWEYEPDYGLLRADGLAAIRNIPTGDFRFCFVEHDRGTNSFDKVEKYCRLYESGGYSGHWWVKLTKRFPPILVATTTARRLEAIQAAIKKENKAGLEFKVMLLEDIKKYFKPQKMVAVLAAFLLAPHAAWAGVAADTLTTVGLPIIQLMVVSAFGALACYITSALGQGQVSSMIKLITVFVCISLVIGVVWQAISAVSKVFGVQL